MIDKIQEKLSCIIGLPIWDIGRSLDMEWFAIGVERREIPLKKGETQVISEFALHVQSAWRITGPYGIIVASNDRNYPAGADPYKDIEEFEWDVPGANRCDDLVEHLLEERKDKPLTILSIKYGKFGNITFTFPDEISLEIFPDSTVASEYWRVFRPYSDEPHFVVGPKGLTLE